MPLRIAAFSAGNPKESKPIGCKTLYPCILRNRAWASEGAIAYQCPMWVSPEGYGYIVISNQFSFSLISST